MPAPNVTGWGASSPTDILALGGTQLTKLAKKFEDLGQKDPIAQLFPSEFTTQRSIVIERPLVGLGIAPLVNPGQPDALYQGTKVERFQTYPAYVRESDFLPEDLINDLRQIGTMNDRHPALEIVAQRMQILVDRNNRLFQVLRAMALLGGISYTDPRTNVAINVNTGIPANNYYSVGAGLSGKWTNLATNFITDLIILKRRATNLNKVTPDTLLMSNDLKTLIEMNTVVKAELEGNGAGNVRGFIRFENGELTHIAGMRILTIDFMYDDPLDGARKKVWPAHQVAMLTSKHEGLTIGRTQYCVGEGPGGPIGMWSRSGPDQAPPAAPGRSVQIGNSGLPYAVYPDWINLLTVADTEAEVYAALGGSIAGLL